MNTASGVDVTGPMHDRYDEVLTPETLGFLADARALFTEVAVADEVVEFLNLPRVRAHALTGGRP